MKGVWFFGNNYVIPNTDNVVLGGTQQKDRWDTNVDIKDTETILSRIGSVFPALARAPIVSAPSRAGIRPPLSDGVQSVAGI